MLISSLVSALAMWLAIWLLTRHETQISLRPVLLVALGTCLLSYFAFSWLGAIGLPVTLVALFFSLMQFCCLSAKRALIVTIVWLIAQVGFGVWVGPIFS